MPKPDEKLIFSISSFYFVLISFRRLAVISSMSLYSMIIPSLLLTYAFSSFGDGIYREQFSIYQVPAETDEIRVSLNL